MTSIDDVAGVPITDPLYRFPWAMIDAIVEERLLENVRRISALIRETCVVGPATGTQGAPGQAVMQGDVPGVVKASW